MVFLGLYPIFTITCNASVNTAIPDALSSTPTVRVWSLVIGNNLGIVDYSQLEDTWTLDGPRNGSFGSSDNFIYNYAQRNGDIDMRLRVTDFTGATSNQGRWDTLSCAGLMIRESLLPGSRYFSIVYCGDKRVRRLRRNNPDGGVNIDESRSDVIEGEVVWLRITFGPHPTNQDIQHRFTVYFSTLANPPAEDWGSEFSGGWMPNFTRNNDNYVGIAVSTGTLEADHFTINDMQALPGYVVLPSTPPAVDGYTSYNQRMCSNDNQFLDVDGVEDEDGLIKVSDAQECASYCDDDCVSFDFFGNSCRVSSSCEHFSLTDPNPASQWYFKNVAPPSYKKFAGRICTVSSSLGATNLLSGLTTDFVQECANNCSEDRDCESFSYRINENKGCLLFSTCREYNDMYNDSEWDTYVKKDEDDDEDQDVCPFLPFAQAEVCCFISYLCL